MLLCAFNVNYAAASGRTDHPRYGPALEIVDRPSANLARFRGTKTVSQAWTFQTLNEGAQASRAYRRAPSIIDLGRKLHPVNWFESFKSPQANLAIHAVRIVHLRKKGMSIRQIYDYTLVETTTPLELPHERRLTSLLKVTNRSARIMICFHRSRTLASWLQHLSQERSRGVQDRNRSWPN